MTTFEVLNERFWCREAYKEVRVEIATESGFWWATFDIPGGWSVNGSNRDFGLPKSLDDSRKRLSNLAREAESYTGLSQLRHINVLRISPTKYRVDDVIRRV